MQTIHYYAQGLLELEDIVASVNRMIDQAAEPRERAAIKQAVRVSGMPLNNRSAGLIIKIMLPGNILSECRKNACCPEPSQQSAEINEPEPAPEKVEPPEKEIDADTAGETADETADEAAEKAEAKTGLKARIKVKASVKPAAKADAK